MCCKRPRSYARPAMRWTGGGAREVGQILPGLVVLLLAILALGVMGFQIGKAAILRSQAQTAADAAALAGAREVRRQLQEQWALFRTTDIKAIDLGRVEAEMRKYANENGGRLQRFDVNGVDIRTTGANGNDANRPFHLLVLC